MRIAKHYKSFRYIDARNARDLMNECAKTSAGMMPFYYERYTMKPCNMDYSLDSMVLVEELIKCIKLKKLPKDELNCKLRSVGYYMGEILKRKIGGFWLEHFYQVSSPTHDIGSEYFRLPNRKFINLEELVVLFFEKGEKYSLKNKIQTILKQGGW